MNNYSTLWEKISPVSSALATIISMVTLCFVLCNNHKGELSKRPYLTISKPRFEIIKELKTDRLIMAFENVGVHPANALSGTIDIFDFSLKKKPAISVNFSIANEFIPNWPSAWWNDDIIIPPNANPHYMVVHFNYFDPILKKEYSQKYFMKWHGMIDGKGPADFVHINSLEKEKILDYLKNLNLKREIYN